MQNLDEKLVQYGTVKNNYYNYGIELKSIRAEIQGMLERNEEREYSNENWKVRLISERNTPSLRGQTLEQALQNANLTPNQEEIFRSAIILENRQQHIKITPIG